MMYDIEKELELDDNFDDLIDDEYGGTSEAYTASASSDNTWRRSHPQNNRGWVNLISDGIIRKKALSLCFDSEEGSKDIPAAATGALNVFSNVAFDLGALTIAMKNGVLINFFDHRGEFIGSFVPHAPLKAPKVTHEQLLAYYNGDTRVYLAKEFLLASIHNTLLNIRYYEKHNPSPDYKAAITKLQYLKRDIKETDSCEGMLLIEARARKIYYSCYDGFIKKEGFDFEKRTKRPPQNRLNALISYGNTVLYSLIATEIQKTALDVRVGFLHATNSRRSSLNLDIAEIFKPLLVDRTVFSLVNKGTLKESHFSFSENGVAYLSAQGKKIFLQAFYAKLNTVITVKGRQISYNGIIIEEIRKLIRHFKGTEKYIAFRQVR